MFRTDPSSAAEVSPLHADWTIAELIDWIGADDARCHDESLRPLLTGILASLDDAEPHGLPPLSTVAMVRALGSRLRAEPAVRALRVRGFDQAPRVGLRTARTRQGAPRAARSRHPRYTAAAELPQTAPPVLGA